MRGHPTQSALVIGHCVDIGYGTASRKRICYGDRKKHEVCLGIKGGTDGTAIEPVRTPVAPTQAQPWLTSPGGPSLAARSRRHPATYSKAAATGASRARRARGPLPGWRPDVRARRALWDPSSARERDPEPARRANSSVRLVPRADPACRPAVRTWTVADKDRQGARCRRWDSALDRIRFGGVGGPGRFYWTESGHGFDTTELHG
jgi:hypothetical protein